MNFFRKSFILLSALGFTSISAATALSVKNDPAEPLDFYSANHKYLIHMEPNKGTKVFLDGCGAGIGSVREAAAGKKEVLWSLPFYAKNVLLMIEHSLGGGWMPWRAGEASLSADQKTVTLPLYDGTTCTFDTATGALVHHVSSPTPK